MIPADNAEINSSNLNKRAINAQKVLIKLGVRKPFVTILLLDCCRTYYLHNPDLNVLVKSVGLANMEEAGSLIAFACKSGDSADDGEEENGLFTKHLLKHITTPNQGVRSLLANVTKGVKDESKPTQIPFQSVSLLESDIYLYVQPTGICRSYKPFHVSLDLSCPLKDREFRCFFIHVIEARFWCIFTKADQNIHIRFFLGVLTEKLLLFVPFL